ncbi:hypothetical protein L218DRAFT_989703 [Marasmius fiardii PR-910]|nr:hypothetical protein L218DRAFT_989703 [Marasmius fiardii PR-910]
MRAIASALPMFSSWAFLFTVGFLLSIVDNRHDPIVCSLGMFACAILHGVDRHLDKDRRERCLPGEIPRKYTDRLESGFEESSEKDPCINASVALITSDREEFDSEYMALFSVDVCLNAVILYWVSSGAPSDSMKDFPLLPQVTLTVGDNWAVDTHRDPLEAGNNIDHNRER